MNGEMTGGLASLRPLSTAVQEGAGDSVAEFDLIRFFSVVCFGCLALVGSILAVLTYMKFSTSVIQTDAMITMVLTQAISEHHGLDQDLNNKEPTSKILRNQDVTEEVGKLLTLVAQMPEVLRANIYSLDKTVVWSTVPQLVGQRFMENEDLDKALAGDPVSQISNLSELRKQEHIFFEKDVDELVEHYFPIWGEGGTKIIAVAEVYKDPEALLHTIRTGMALISVTAFLAGVFIHGILLSVICRASRILCNQKEQLEESQTLAAVGEMASIFAHGIRNPLTSIRTSAEIALDEQDPEVHNEAARDIVAETDRIEKWVRELIQASPGERADLRHLDIVRLLRNCLDQFSHAMKRQGVTAVLDERDPVAQIYGDRPLLEQAFNSLISNAMEAMPEGGELTIRIGMAKSGVDIEVSLADTGCGIPAERLSKIIKPFYTTKTSSSGLGLPLAKRIVERHGGDIEIISKEGVGTTVFLRLPLGVSDVCESTSGRRRAFDCQEHPSIPG